MSSNSNYQFDVNKIVAYLKRFSDNLPNLYGWNAKLEKLITLKVLTNEEVTSLNQMKPFDKEIIIKETVCKKLNEFYSTHKGDFDNLCLWIIKDWGGIKSPKDTDTLNLIAEFLNEQNPKFERIASSSKVGSYMFPDRYIIYDSRVAYSLNWIILSEDAGDKFFPIPSGRNSKMSAFDMNALIRLKYINNYRPQSISKLSNKQYINNLDKSLYIPKKLAYTELNKLIKAISKKLWNEEKSEKLYYTEMLLFSIADKEVFDDITQKVQINIE